MTEIKESKPDQQQHWDEVFAKNPEFFGKGPSHFAQRSLDLLQRTGVRSLLELGCGQGRDTFLFAQSGLEVTALDYSETVVSAVREKAKASILPCSIHVQAHDVKKPLPFPDNSFDACYSHMLLCMELTTAEIEFILRETHRILKPGGLMLYSVRNSFDKHYQSGTHLSEEMYDIGGFVIHFFSEEKVRALATGYEILKIDRMEEGSLPRDLFVVSLKKLAGAMPDNPQKDKDQKNMSEVMKKFQEFLDASLASGVLENKTKQLVALGAALAAGCDSWADFGLAVAREAKATEEEIEEVAAIAMAVNAFKTRSMYRSKVPAAPKTAEPLPQLKAAEPAAPKAITWGVWTNASGEASNKLILQHNWHTGVLRAQVQRQEVYKHYDALLPWNLPSELLVSGLPPAGT